MRSRDSPPDVDLVAELGRPPLDVLDQLLIDRIRGRQPLLQPELSNCASRAFAGNAVDCADIDAKDSWNGTGLIRAAERGHHLVVGRLLRAGIDKDHVNRIGYQAVHEAVWFGADAADEVATVQVLVAGGVDLGRPSVTERLGSVGIRRGSSSKDPTIPSGVRSTRE